MRNNQICQHCGKEFHYCDSCGYVEYNTHGFCSTECLNNNVISTKDLWNNWDELAEGSVIKRVSCVDYFIVKTKYGYDYYDVVSDKVLNDGCEMKYCDSWIYLYNNKNK